MSGATEQVQRPDHLPSGLDARCEPAPEGELRLRVAPDGFERASRVLSDAGGRFVTLLLADWPERSLVAVFALRGDLVVLRASLQAGAPLPLPALSAWCPGARWAEQELLERLEPATAAHRSGPSLTEPDASVLHERVGGLDVFSLPFGPVRSGVFESIQFLIETGGEDVLALQTRPFFKHRGLEARVVGLRPDRAVHVVERIAGIAGVAYACAFSQAVERALGIDPPVRAERWRAVHAELERIACHLDVIAKEAETTALYVGQARFQILKEQTMRLRATLTGSRFGRGVVVPGGVRFDGRCEPDDLLGAIDALDRDLRRDRRLFLSTASMTDRLVGAGHLARELVEQYCAVGPLARGSGLSTDARHERPYGDYRRLGLRVTTARDGDAMARINVRFGELAESLRILRQSIDRLRRHDGELMASHWPDEPRQSGAALGWSEAPQGELVVWVEVRAGLIHHVHVASPSLRNWALFDHAFPKDVLTDFAFIEHSFGLTPAGADR
ncbi:MAG: NADH-quinone oxidoreductase subunit D [Solirubrobacteraceae bacterium]